MTCLFELVEPCQPIDLDLLYVFDLFGHTRQLQEENRDDVVLVHLVSVVAGTNLLF
jgi:hypothetical protein